jgi:hypothetical protein
MGDVSLNSFTGAGFNIDTHEAFQLKVERVKFEHTTHYGQWKDKVSLQQPMLSSFLPTDSPSPTPSPPMLLHSDSDPTLAQRKVTFGGDAALKKKRLLMTKILEDFSSTVLLLKKRSLAEMATPEMIQALTSDLSPAI